MMKHCSVLYCLVLFVSLASAQLHIVPDHVGDKHFTSGPCPNIVPKDGASCPGGAQTCAAFYDPSLLPSGYNSVSYCAAAPGLGFGASGFGLLTLPLDKKEQRAFLRAAETVGSYVGDRRTVVMEPYKVAFILNGTNYTFFYANSYWNPVCAVDALLPPFSNTQPIIVQNSDGSYSYQGLPETYSVVLNALKSKNASNQSPMELINHLPGRDEINMEWPPTFFGWQASTDLASDLVSNFLVGISNNYPISSGTKPFTLCSSPAAMKMLGFGPSFATNGHTIDDMNAPQYNMNITLPGTDGAVVVPDLTAIPPANTPPLRWIYDDRNQSIIRTQLPKAYYEKSANFALPKLSCDDSIQCVFPKGFNGGLDLTGLFHHEINHVLGVMQSQYYKVPYEDTSLGYTYGNALFLLDLFDLDSDYVVSGYGHSGIHTYDDFKSAPRHNNTYVPTTIYQATSASQLTPWIQFGSHDHLMVYGVNDGQAQYVPLENYSVFNPDGDVQLQWGLVANSAGTQKSLVFIDPDLISLPPMDVVHFNLQAAERDGIITVNSIWDYSEVASQGWDVDYSTLRRSDRTISPLATWYRTCFDENGMFTTAKNSHCKFSVLPKDLEFLH